MNIDARAGPAPRLNVELDSGSHINGRSERRAKRVRSSAGLANTVDTQWPSSVHTK